MGKKASFILGTVTGILAGELILVGAGIYICNKNGIVLAPSSLLSSVTADAAQSSSGDDSSFVNDEFVGKLQKLEWYIDQAFLMEEAGDEDIQDAVYKAVMDELGDPYSCYYTEEEFAQLMESTSGTYSGIGVMVSQNAETKEISVIRVFEGSPGEEAGLLPGDIILGTTEEDFSKMDLTTAVTYMKGEEGTYVDIRISRSSEELTLHVQRRKIEVPTVESTMLDGQIGYIQVTEFDDVTSDQFKEKVDALKAEGMKGLIVDLRDNPGGLLDVVVSMLDYMLPEGKIVYTLDKYQQGDVYKSDAEHYFDLPLAVLVNGNSASASEIFAGAIKDYGVGTIVGTTTFGKGIVQHLYPLGDGTAIKITTSYYYTPNDICIHGVGIEPDVEVELKEELQNAVSISMDEDNQLQTAVSVLLEKINSEP